MVVAAGGGAPRELNPGIAADAEDVVWEDAESLLWIASRGVERALERQRLDGPPATVLAGGGPIWSDLELAPGSGALALVADSPAHPEELFLGGLDGAAPRRVSDSNPWLADRRLAPQEAVSFRARDGLELEGLLIRPLAPAAGERVPLVLVVHGGPEAHFANGWLTTYSRPGQLLAARGFAVFYPNYRGSTGRGLEFAKTSQADPAGKEFDDLVDAVDHLIAAGLVDRERVGVTGGSYGGYATAWSATRHSERFAAGVMFVGISEKVAKLGTSDIPVELYSVHARRWPWENWQLMLERSPVYWVEQARTPLLILGGDADPRVHPSQSLVLYRYLKLLDKAPVRYVVYPGEKHGNRNAAARLDYTLRAVRWFEHYLQGPGGAPPPPAVDYGLAE
jgi:dipeptidyl aminopeptidase/acylaminoacyl peptidase